MDLRSNEDGVGYYSETTFYDISIYFHQFCFLVCVCTLHFRCPALLNAALMVFFFFVLDPESQTPAPASFKMGFAGITIHFQYISTFLLEGAVCSYP